MDQYQHFTSLPPEEEKTFVVYEARTQQSAKKALTTGLVTAGVLFVLVVAVVFSHDKPKNLMEGEDMGMLADEKERASTRSDMAESPTPAAPAAPAEATPAEGAAEGGDEEAAEGEAAEGGDEEAAEGEAAEGGDEEPADDTEEN